MPIPGYRSLLTDQTGWSGVVQPLRPQVGQEIAYSCGGAWSEWMSKNPCTCYYGGPSSTTVVTSNQTVSAEFASENKTDDQSALLDQAARILEALLRAGQIDDKEDWHRYLSELRRDLLLGAAQAMDFFPTEIDAPTPISDWDALRTDWAAVHNDFSTVWQAIAHAHHIVAEEDASHDGRDSSRSDCDSPKRQSEFIF
jgi:hypothetical protein